MNKKVRKPADQDVVLNKGMAGLSYVFILCVIPLVFYKKSEYVQFHAKQGLVLFIIEIIIWIIPIFGQLLMLAFLVISLIAIARVLRGEWWKIPFVYKWSKKINLRLEKN